MSPIGWYSGMKVGNGVLCTLPHCRHLGLCWSCFCLGHISDFLDFFPRGSCCSALHNIATFLCSMFFTGSYFRSPGSKQKILRFSVPNPGLIWVSLLIYRVKGWNHVVKVGYVFLYSILSTSQLLFMIGIWYKLSLVLSSQMCVFDGHWSYILFILL